MTNKIIDNYGRMFKILRISLTNACNLGCVYCVSGNNTEETTPINLSNNQPSLSFSEIIKAVKSLHELLNLEVIRLTGGEPTLYHELVPLITGLKELGIPEIKMTSNGFLLKSKARQLASAGLSNLNISLDAIGKEEYIKISRRKNLAKIIEGIDEAIANGIKVKLNTVVMRGLNDHQIVPLLDFASERNIHIRFLELMKMGHLHSGSFSDYFYSEKEILHQIGKKYSFEKLTRQPSSTANYWITNHGKVFGIVANESEPFCFDCNRLRLDSFGNIYGCLSEDKPIFINNCTKEELTEKLSLALSHKQSLKFKGSGISMLAIGG